MKRILVIATTVLLAVLLFTVPVFAYVGVTGTVIDSATLQPWIHGGEVFVLNQTTGAMVATCTVTMPAGTFNCVYGVDALGVGPPPAMVVPATGDIIKIIIDFNCPIGGIGPGGNCLGPYNPAPPGNTETTYTELAFLPGNVSVGRLKTGTGPNAVTLAGASAESPNVWLAVALGAVALVGAGGVVLLLRRQRVA